MRESKGLETAILESVSGLGDQKEDEFWKIFEIRSTGFFANYIIAIIFPIHFFLRRSYVLGTLFLITIGGYGIWWLIEILLVPRRTRQRNNIIAKKVLVEVDADNRGVSENFISNHINDNSIVNYLVQSKDTRSDGEIRTLFKGLRKNGVKFYKVEFVEGTAMFRNFLGLGTPRVHLGVAPYGVHLFQLGFQNDLVLLWSDIVGLETFETQKETVFSRLGQPAMTGVAVSPEKFTDFEKGVALGLASSKPETQKFLRFGCKNEKNNLPRTYLIKSKKSHQILSYMQDMMANL